MKRIFLVFLSFSLFCSASYAKKSYEVQRQELIESNVSKLKVSFTENDRAVETKYNRLREEFKKSSEFPYECDFLTDHNIWNSELYGFLSRMPKGADLHVHTDAILPVKELVEFLKTRDDIYICLEEPAKYYLYFKNNENKPEGCILFSEAAKDERLCNEILPVKWTVNGCGENQDIWEFFETLFNKDEAICSSSLETYGAYYSRVFEYYKNLNINHVELKVFFFGSKEDSEVMAKKLREVYYEFRKSNPDFTVKTIACSGKNSLFTEEYISMLTENAVYLHNAVKDEFNPSCTSDFVVAYDMVNEEDKSRPLYEFQDLIEDIKKRSPGLHIALHAGESNNPRMDNVIDAYLLGSERIGHGFNLFKYPDLQRKIISKDICIEVCPVSNKTLRYINNYGAHPAISYIKKGIPVVLASDDPAYQEHRVLVDDYFVASVCWDLSLRELKQLAFNSINYSFLNSKEKKTAIDNWNRDWKLFIESEL